MAGKYSAEWWEKIADINREISARHDPSSVVDDLIQATANGRPSPMTKSETPLRGAGSRRRNRAGMVSVQILSI